MLKDHKLPPSFSDVPPGTASGQTWTTNIKHQLSHTKGSSFTYLASDIALTLYFINSTCNIHPAGGLTLAVNNAYLSPSCRNNLRLSHLLRRHRRSIIRESCREHMTKQQERSRSEKVSIGYRGDHGSCVYEHVFV